MYSEFEAKSTIMGIFLTNFGTGEHHKPQERPKGILRPHKKILVSLSLKIEKVMRACVFYSYFLSFLQGQFEIIETRIILHFPHIM